jgi:PTH1 family peptidyl-tRNA hydrolase
LSLAFRLIVGLGNPGPKYDQTRHNAGFWLVDEIARRYRLNFAPDSRSQGLAARMDWEGEAIHLLKPMRFMNLSGGAVSALANFYKIEPARILVAHDELDFEPGVVRLKIGGGHGGHNGLRDIVAKLGSAGFARVRLGIGHPGSREQVVSYVLDRPSRHEGELLQEAVGRVVEHFPQILAGRLDAVMNALHQ